MDGETYSILSILTSGFVEDPHLYDQVIKIALRPGDDPRLHDFAATAKVAFEKLWTQKPRPQGRLSNKEAYAHIDDLAVILRGMEGETAEWVCRSLLWTMKQIKRDEARVAALRSQRCPYCGRNGH